VQSPLRANLQHIVKLKIHIYYNSAILLQDPFSQEAIVFVPRKYKNMSYSACLLKSEKYKHIFSQWQNGEIVVCIWNSIQQNKYNSLFTWSSLWCLPWSSPSVCHLTFLFNLVTALKTLPLCFYSETSTWISGRGYSSAHDTTLSFVISNYSSSCPGSVYTTKVMRNKVPASISRDSVGPRRPWGSDISSRKWLSPLAFSLPLLGSLWLFILFLFSSLVLIDLTGNSLDLSQMIL
jgi:hypothetical protein